MPAKLSTGVQFVSMKWHRLLIPIGVLSALSLTGCVQRTISIRSDPAGALVHLNDEEIGRTPLTVPFTFYGTYQVQLQRAGYETILTKRTAQAPWWDLPGPDLIAEILPGRREVHIDWEFALEKRKLVDPQALIERAKQLRKEIHSQN